MTLAAKGLNSSMFISLWLQHVAVLTQYSVYKLLATIVTFFNEDTLGNTLILFNVIFLWLQHVAVLTQYSVYKLLATIVTFFNEDTLGSTIILLNVIFLYDYSM